MQTFQLPFRNFEQSFTSSSSTSTSRFIDTRSEVTHSGSDTASQQLNFFEISIWLEVSRRWYFCKDLTYLWPTRSITNFSGIPFCSPRVAVVARRLLFVNWPNQFQRLLLWTKNPWKSYELIHGKFTGFSKDFNGIFMENLMRFFTACHPKKIIKKTLKKPLKTP